MKAIYPIDNKGFVIWQSKQYRMVEDTYMPGECEIDIPIPRDTSWIRPRWDGNNWIEDATPEEIEADRPPYEPTGFTPERITTLCGLADAIRS